MKNTEARRRLKTAPLLKNPKLAVKMGREAHKKVGKHFLISRYLKENLEIYREILK